MGFAIHFPEERAMLLDIASKFFRDRWPTERVREEMSTESGYDSALWNEMADLGWLGMAIPEAHGGSGLGLAELVPIAEPMGRSLFASPFFSTQLAIQALLHGGDDAQQQAWLPELAGGAVATVAAMEEDGSWDLVNPGSTGDVKGFEVSLRGRKCFVGDAAAADLILVTVTVEGAPALVLVERQRLEGAVRTMEREVLLDETKRSYRLSLEGIEVPSSALITGDAAMRALAAVRHTALLLLAAEACGGIAGALDLILEYLKTRTQFGRLIGSYQALKHPSVDILIGLERSRSHLYHAATVLEEDGAEVALRMAKAAAADAFTFAADRGIQFHGAFGFTYECDAQLYLRRAMWLRSQYGDCETHRTWLAETLLGGVRPLKE